MGNISGDKIPARDVSYYRQRLKNRVFSKLVEYFSEEAARTGANKRSIAARLGKDPSQITRWLSNPSNLTLETISDLLLALEAEIKEVTIVRFSDIPVRNYIHDVLDWPQDTSANWIVSKANAFTPAESRTSTSSAITTDTITTGQADVSR